MLIHHYCLHSRTLYKSRSSYFADCVHISCKLYIKGTDFIFRLGQNLHLFALACESYELEGQIDEYFVEKLRHNGAVTGLLHLNQSGKYLEREREKIVI